MADNKLDDMWLAHIEQNEHKEHSWERGLLHVSDLCSCPRAVALRLLGEERRPLERPEKWEKFNNFFMANYLHNQCYEAWSRAGILIEKELSIRGYLPKGWTGRFDAVINYEGGPRIADVKTVRYLAKSTHYPYLKHLAQAVTYHLYVSSDFQLSEDPILYYIQRDMGQPSSIETTVSVNENTIYFVENEMKKLEDMKSNLPELPSILTRELKYTGKKKKGEYQEISAVMNHLCSTKWCDYSCHTCEPETGSELVAYRLTDGDWAMTDFGEEFHNEDIQVFLETEAYGDI